MELRRIVGEWPVLLARLTAAEVAGATSLARSCRPIEAERLWDGKLVVVLGCWHAAELERLGREPLRSQLEERLGKLLEEKIELVITRWPGGFLDERASEPRVAGETGASPAESNDGDLSNLEDADLSAPPDPLAGLPADAHAEAAKCESAIQRLFFATAYRRGLRLVCQYDVLIYRLDFADLSATVGAEVSGWDWHRRSQPGITPRDRELELGSEGWQVRWFAGAEVLDDVEGCVDVVEDLIAASSTLRSPEVYHDPRALRRAQQMRGYRRSGAATPSPEPSWEERDWEERDRDDAHRDERDD
ncbi:MAG: hypothetical protein HY329_08030 [Chloroflexi bacterium]|nr:hypothetical protein [Chloroflexota bacterium]